MVLLGRTANAPIDIDLLEQQLGSPGYRRIAASLRQVGFQTATNLLATYAGQASDLQPWLQNAEINRDGNLRLQYLAGLALNLSEETYIYNQMLNYRRFPEGLFAASPERLASLRAALGLP
jgi:spermidine synthase